MNPDSPATWPINLDNRTPISPFWTVAHAGLREIIFPEGMTKIPYGALELCYYITSVTLPSTLIEIDDYAFVSALLNSDSTSHLTYLNQVVIPKSVKRIGKNALQSAAFFKLDGEAINELNPEIVIDNLAFSYSYQLKNVKIDNRFTGKFLGGMFNSEPNLESLDLSSANIDIPANAITNNPKLITLKLGSGIKSIGNKAFYNNTALTTVDLTGVKVSLGEEAFSNCTSLEKVDFSVSSIKVLPKRLFANCTALKEIVLDRTIEAIEDNAFIGCPNLKTITIYVDNPNLPEAEKAAFFGENWVSRSKISRTATINFVTRPN